MSNSIKADLNLLKSYKSSFDTEKQCYIHNAYNTFSGGYISHCSDQCVQRMKANLSYHYDGISSAYSKIDNWWTNYNNDLENLEKGLSKDRAVSSGIKDSSVVSQINSLPHLADLNIDSFYTFAERKQKGEELKKHYSQKAAPINNINEEQPKVINIKDLKNAYENSKTKEKSYSEIAIKADELKKHYSQATGAVNVEEWREYVYEKNQKVTQLDNAEQAAAEAVKKSTKSVGKKIWDGVSDAWCMIECAGTDILGYLGDGLTMFKAGGTIALGTVVSTFRVIGGDLTWKDVKYANGQILDEAMDQIDERREATEVKKDSYMDESIKRKNEYTVEDYWKKLPATVADVGYNFGKGVVGLGEKIRDSAATTADLMGGGIAYVAGRAQGIDDKYLKDMINEAHEETAAEVAEDMCQTYMFDEAEQSELGQKVIENSALGDTEREFVQGVGEVAGTIALSAALTPGAVGGGATISPVAMGGVGFVTGQGEGLQNAYADGADFYAGYGYGTVNGIIEGASWYIGGKINMSFRAENMGSKYMFEATKKRILFDTLDAGAESTLRTESAILYKRKEDGSWYTPAEIWEMYDGSAALEQNVLLGFLGSLLGEMGELNQAKKISKLEKVIDGGNLNKFASNINAKDFTDYMKFAKDADVDTLLKNVDNESIKQLATIPDSSVLKKFMSCADADQKKIFVNSLTDSSAKELLKDIPDEMLEDVIKNANADSLTMIVKNANSKEMVESIADIYEMEYKKQIDSIVYTSKDDLAANVDSIKRTIDLDDVSKSKKERYFETLNYGETDFGVDQNALTKYIPTVNNEEFKIIANDPRFYDLWYEDAVKLNPNIKVTRELSDSTVESLKNSGYTYSSQVNRTRRVLLQIYDGDQEKVLDQMKKLFDYKYSEDIMRLKNKPEFINMNMNDFEKILFFANNPEGICDYAAFCNSIFEEFKNKPNAFKEVFGYDMYTIIDGKKHLNSDELLLDLYTSVNSKNISSLATFYVPEEYKHRFIFNDGQLSIVDLNQRKNALGRGLGYDNTIINEWLASKGSNVKVKIDPDFSYRFIESNIFDKNMTADEVKKLFKKYDDSSVIIGINKDKIPLNFYDENGNIYLSTHTWSEGAGHAVYLTDITDDGIIVSSWGKKLKLTYEELSKTGFYTYDVKFDNIKTDDLFSIESLPSDNKLARRNQYNILKNKLDSGIELTADEKVLLSKLSIETEIDKININERISTTMEEIEKLKKKAALENNDEKLLELTYKLEEYKKINEDLESLKEMLHKNNIYDIKKLDHDHAVAIGLIPKDLKPENQDISIDIKKYLDDKVNEIEKRAKKFEPEVFSDLREYETEDLVLINEDYRIKSSGSISDKLLSDAKKQVQSPIDISYKDIDEAADKMKDSLRGTFISNPDNYKENVIKTVSELKDKGYKVIKVGNSWGSDSKYQGINVGFVKEINGEELKLEVQFHTFDSFVTKEGLTHTLYEVARNDFVPDNIRTFANDIQCKYQKLVVVPDGAEEININLFNK